MPAGVPQDHVPASDETAPVALHDRAELALEEGEVEDWLRCVSGQLNAISEQIGDEVIDYLPFKSPVRDELKQEAERLLQQAQRLLDLADPVRAAIDE